MLASKPTRDGLHAGNVAPNNNFVCELICGKGPDALANMTTGKRANLPAGIYNPPYRYLPLSLSDS